MSRGCAPVCVVSVCSMHVNRDGCAGDMDVSVSEGVRWYVTVCAGMSVFGVGDICLGVWCDDSCLNMCAEVFDSAVGRSRGVG